VAGRHAESLLLEVEQTPTAPTLATLAVPISMRYGPMGLRSVAQGGTIMHIDELRTFVEVADTLGVSPAARRLGVAKSVVSRRLFRLEADLGVQLLSRTTRGAVLTEAGAAFRDHAARICAEVDTARETIAPQGELQGRLRVAAPLTFGPTHYAPALAEMARRHPKLTLQTCYSDRFVDLVAEGFDCAIRVGYL
ncbi:hypothetical protein LTR94_031471, partial [Friedmanniomyces endolithicus]